MSKAKGPKLTAAQRRANRNLSLSPQYIRPDEWYYEEPGHIHVVIWTTLERAYSRGGKMVAHTRIPWNALAKSLRRYRAYKRTTTYKAASR